MGKHFLGGWSWQQSYIALSSGEAELIGIVNTCSRALWLQRFLEETGHALHICVGTDSSAAKGMCARLGCGKVRHLHVKYLWVQDLGRAVRPSAHQDDRRPGEPRRRADEGLGPQAPLGAHGSTPVADTPFDRALWVVRGDRVGVLAYLITGPASPSPSRRGS